MKRRIIAALMALCLCIGLLPATALAVEGPTDRSDSLEITKETTRRNGLSWSNVVAAEVGDEITYEITIENHANEAATDVVVSDSFFNGKVASVQYKTEYYETDAGNILGYHSSESQTLQVENGQITIPSIPKNEEVDYWIFGVENYPGRCIITYTYTLQRGDAAPYDNQELVNTASVGSKSDSVSVTVQATGGSTNDSEFHIMDWEALKDFVREAYDLEESEKITIHAIKVNGETILDADGSATGGAANYTNKGDYGVQGLNGILAANHDIWKVFNDAAIIKPETVTSITVLAKTRTTNGGFFGNELEPLTIYLDEDDIKLPVDNGYITQIYLKNASLEPIPPEQVGYTIHYYYVDGEGTVIKSSVVDSVTAEEVTNADVHYKAFDELTDDNKPAGTYVFDSKKSSDSFRWTMDGQEFHVYFALDADENGTPDYQEKDDITGFEKALVTGSAPEGVSIPADVTVEYPASVEETVKVPADSTVTLMYQFTVEGVAGTSFTIMDNGAVAVGGNYNTETSVSGTISGVVPDSGTAVIYVIKTFAANEIDVSSGTGYLTNHATISVDEGDTIADGEDQDDENVPAEITIPRDVYVYLQVKGSGQNGDLTDEDLATISEWGLEKSNPDDYYILGKLSDVELPEGIPTTGELTYEKYATYIEQAFTGNKFKAYKENSVIDEDFLNGIAWENLVWASGAPGYESETQEGNCLHLDGVLKLEEPGEQGLSVTKSVKLLEDDVPKEIPFEGVDVNDTLQYTVTVTNNGDATEPYAVVIYDSFFESDAVAVNPVGVADVTTASATITSALNNGDSVTFTYTHIVTEQDQNEGQVFNAASVRLNNEVKDEATVTVPVKAKTYDLIYNANGGTFADTQGTFVVEDLASGTEYTLGSEGNYRVPTHADGSLDGKTVGVEFVGWTLSNNQGFIYRAGATNVPDLRDKVTIQSPGVTVYAVWGYDENGDGVADINQIVVKPADITIYMGGTGYEGTVDANGNTITSTAGAGLPEPGFIVTLPSGAPANTVITNLVFKEADGDRTWRFETYDGREDTVVYKLVPQGDEQTATRVQFTKADGTVIVSDEFTVGLEVNTSFTMALYKGSGATAVGKIVADIGGKSYSVNSDPTGTLTVRGTTDDAQYAGMTAEETRSLPEEGKPAVMAPRGTTYAINGGDVQVADTDGVALLFDAVIDHADENRTELLQNRAEAYFADKDVEPETGNKFAYEFKYLDLVDQNNGNVWVKASNDVTIYWPLPEGADTNTLKVLHFKDLHREMATADIESQIEQCDVEAIDVEVVGSHVTFKIGSSGFSPFALVWQEKDGTTPAQYTVTYHENFGSSTDTRQNDFAAGTQVTVITNPFGGHSNYAFDGWNTRADGNGTSYDPGDPLTVTGNITLYAQWRYTGGGEYNPKDATLRFNSRGGTEFEDEVRDNPFRYNPYNKIPTRPGYRFTGWYDSSRLDDRYDEDEEISVPMGITTVWAGWEETSVPSMLNGDDHYAYIQGYSDGTVRPNANITRAQVATIFFRLLDEDVRDDNLTTYNTFPDVDQDYWANTAISTMASLGVINGRNSGLFDPDAYITRAEFAAICARFDDSGVDGITTFTDTVGHWAEDEISRAAALGWIQGYADGTFRPNQYITRAQAVTMINRVLCRLPEDTDDLLSGMNTWTDCHEDDWFYLAIQEATNSHDFVAKDRVYESWTDLNRAPDWSRYE